MPQVSDTSWFLSSFSFLSFLIIFSMIAHWFFFSLNFFDKRSEFFNFFLFL